MNINPDKVKRLVMIFAELDEEYQQKLLEEAYILQLMQGQKNNLQKEGLTFKTKEEFEKEIRKKTNEISKEILELKDLYDSVSDTKKAAMFMLINRLADKNNVIQEADISITVNQKDISWKEYIEKYLVNADYDKAKQITEEYLKEMNIV